MNHPEVFVTEQEVVEEDYHVQASPLEGSLGGYKGLFPLICDNH